MRRTCFLLFAVLLTMLSQFSPASAAQPTGDVARIVPLKPTHTRGYYFAKMWGVRPITVCWNMTGTDYNRTLEERRAIRAEIESTWVKNADVSFAGWLKCGSSITNGFGIVGSDERPHTVALGTDLNGNLSAMVLNFDYKAWTVHKADGSDLCSKSSYGVPYCDMVIAAHEFGHALGIAHEQNRPDNPDLKSCPADAGGQAGGVTVGAYDINSIMNYCNPNYNGDGKLSVTDIQTIQKMYGPPGRPANVSYQMQFDTKTAGDCILSGAAITINPDGTAIWSAQVRTTSDDDAWLADVTLLDAAGKTITPIAHFGSVSLNNHLWHPWTQHFTFDPKLFGVIAGAHLRSRC